MIYKHEGRNEYRVSYRPCFIEKCFPSHMKIIIDTVIKAISGHTNMKDNKLEGGEHIYNCVYICIKEKFPNYQK